MALGWGVAAIRTGAALSPAFSTVDHWPRDPSSVPPAALTGAEISDVLQQRHCLASPKHPLLKGGFKREESRTENTELSWNKVIVSIPHLQGYGEPSQGPPVPLGSLELPTEQTVIRKWGDQQQAQGCVYSVYTEHRLPRRALHTDLFALCFFMGCAGGEQHKYEWQGLCLSFLVTWSGGFVLGRLGSRLGRPTPGWDGSRGCWDGSRGCWDPNWLLQVSSYRVGRMGRIKAFI